MISLLFLCIKLSILHFGVSDLEYQCIEDNKRNDPKIFVITDPWETINEDASDYQNYLSHEFQMLCGQYYDITLGSPDEAKEYTNVIHFAVTDFYYGKPLKDFEYAGNVTNTDDVVCHKKKMLNNDEAHPKYECKEMAMLVSKSLTKINEGHIYDFVQMMPGSFYFRTSERARKSCEPFYRSTMNLTTVVLCLHDPIQIREVNILPLRLIQMSVSDCLATLNGEGYERDTVSLNRILAVVTPEPLKVYSEHSVPTIFYESPYLFTDNRAAFPNSMNLVPWRLLKHGFLKFIRTVGWQRVAIVTDDSEYSIEFEDGLIALFNKEQLIYTVIRCEDAKCEMDKILQELNTVSARIVIANVEVKNAKYLFRNSPRSITWLARDLTKRNNIQVFDNQNVFSFSWKYYKTKVCDVEDNILISLSSIAQAYKKITNDDHNQKKPEFYRRFADNTRPMLRISKGIVVVNRIKNHDWEQISRILVYENGATKISPEHPIGSDELPDGTGQCLVTSYDYHKPCENELVLLLMFVIMMFVLTFLSITCYFDKTSPFNDIRYQNF